MPSSKPSSLRRFVRICGLIFALLAAALVSQVRSDIPLSALTGQYAGGASRFMEIEGMRVHYRDEGKGAPVLLLHGTSSSLHTWDGWVTGLSGTHRVVRLDMPGYGLTGPAPDHDYSPSRLARVSLAVLDALHIERADVAGNSLGGRVALTLALEHRERVRKLVLVDAAGMSGLAPPLVFRLARVPVVNQLVRWVTPRWTVRSNVQAVYADPTRITPELVDRYEGMLRREGNRQALIDRFTGRPYPDLDARLGELKLPTLLLWGEQDRWIPLSFGERMHAGIAGSKLITYADAGHVAMEELPERTVADAMHFLDADARLVDSAPSAP